MARKFKPAQVLRTVGQVTDFLKTFPRDFKLIIDRDTSEGYLKIGYHLPVTSESEEVVLRLHTTLE